MGGLWDTGAPGSQPEKGGRIGCGMSQMGSSMTNLERLATTSDCDGGDDFDHWNNHAMNGAISKLCFKLGSPKWIHPNADWITGGKFCYAGKCFSHGSGDTGTCFSLSSGEAIAELTATTGCVPNGANHWGVSSIAITTTNGR